MAARNVVNRQLAFLQREGSVLPVPANLRAMPGQHGALLGCEKTFVLLKRSVDAVPGVRLLALIVGNPVEAVEDPAVMRRMHLGIVIQTASDYPVPRQGKDVMEDLVGSNATFGRG